MSAADLLTPWTCVSLPGEDPPADFALVILAAGQSTRLGLHGPKAFFRPLSDRSDTMLELLLAQVASTVPIAVMIDPAAKSLWEEFLGKHPTIDARVQLFLQTCSPLMTLEQQPMLGTLAPDGNGAVFACLQTSGLLAVWEERKVERIVIAPIDNLLAPRSFLPLASFAKAKDADWAVLALPRGEETTAGVLALKAGKLCIRDYMEVKTFEEFKYINAGVYCLQLSLWKRLAQLPMPLHWVRKEYKLPSRDQAVPVVKAEKFLFDLLDCALKPHVLCMEKAHVFAPIKELRDVLLLQNGSISF